MADQLTKLQKRLAAIPREVKVAVEPALLRAAERVADQQRRLAPVDDGALRDSITVTGPGQPTPAYSQPGGLTVVPENAVMITAGNEEVRYAHLVEHGTAPHDVSKGAASLKGRIRKAFGGGTHHPGTEAQPFFWPGFRLERNGALREIRRAISKAVKKAR